MAGVLISAELQKSDWFQPALIFFDAFNFAHIVPDFAISQTQRFCDELLPVKIAFSPCLKMNLQVEFYLMSASPMRCIFSKLVEPCNATGAPKVMTTVSPFATIPERVRISSACKIISSVVALRPTRCG